MWLLLFYHWQEGQVSGAWLGARQKPSYPLAYCPPGRDLVVGCLYPRALPPVTHSSTFHAPECLWLIFLPRIRGRWSCGGKKRSKSLLLSRGLHPYSLMRMLSHGSELPCLTRPIRLVCPKADRKASKQNSCPWQYKMSLHGGYWQLPQTYEEPVLRMFLRFTTDWMELNSWTPWT